jgi:hypothetical protein
MNHTKQSSIKSILNWLGAGVLVLFVVGLVYLTMSGRPVTEPTDAGRPHQKPFLLSPSGDLNSPLPAAMSSPLPAALNSPLPVEAPMITVSPQPIVSLTPPLPTSSSTTFQLTVLHTNDTWGYLLPCG